MNNFMGYDDTDIVVKQALARLEESLAHHDYQEARNAYAILHSNPLSTLESKRMHELIDMYMPEHERSVRSLDPKDIVTFEQAYGRNIETMNKEQFLLLARDIVEGRVKKNPDVLNTGPLLVYSFLRTSMFTPGDCAKLFVKAIDAAKLRLVTQDNVHSQTYDDWSLLTGSICLTGHTYVDSAYDAVIRVLEMCITWKFFPNAVYDEFTEPVKKRFDGVFVVAVIALGNIIKLNEQRRQDTKTMVVKWFKDAANSDKPTQQALDHLHSIFG